MQITYYNRIMWDLRVAVSIDKNVQIYNALPTAAGQYGAEYAIETAPPSQVYELTASAIPTPYATLLQSCADDPAAIFILVTNTDRTITGRVIAFSAQEIAGTNLSDVSVRLRDTGRETEIGDNFNIFSFTSV